MSELYPNSGEFFGVPVNEEQKQEIKQDKAQAVQAKPVIKKALKYLDELIVFYGSIESISDDVLTNPNEFMHVVAANKLTKQSLVQVREYLNGLIES